MSRPGASHVAALDPYLVGLIAYLTMISLVGRQSWRNALWVAVSVYSVVHVAALNTTVLALLIHPGRGPGDRPRRQVRGRLGVAAPQRPRHRGVPGRRRRAGDRDPAGSPAQDRGRRISPLRGHDGGGHGGGGHGGGGHGGEATAGDGKSLDVVVYDRDQQAAGAIYRVYRSGPAARAGGHATRRCPWITRSSAGRCCRTPPKTRARPRRGWRALVRVGPEAAALAYTHHEGTTLANRNPGCSDAELRQIWDAVSALHAHRVTHRALTADRILLTGDGQAILLDPGDGDVAATDLQIRLDISQLLAELALYVGPERTVDLALAKSSADELVAVVPLLQPVALARSTRKALRRRRDVLPALRKLLSAAVPAGSVVPVRLERIRLRTLLTMVASVVAAYLLAGELERASLVSVLRSADWRWSIAGLALSATTYIGATLSLSGFVAARLSFFRTLLVQVAGSFVTLVTPAAVGGPR